jgi:C-terminal processing protease CtpA/Prc
MKKQLYYITILLFLHFACCLKEHEYIPTQEDTNKLVNEWIYKTMYNYYYWETELPSKPDYLEKPDVFFKSLLFVPTDRFSWINERKQDNQDILNGITESFGFEYILAYKDTNHKELYGIILYVTPNTPASSANLKRGDMFFKIDKEELNTDNYSFLLSKKTASYTFQNNHKEKFDIELTTAKIKENPIHFKNIYEFGNHKIGYLVYNLFTEDSGNGMQSYWKDLLDTFTFFKNSNITEFVLDLRYNSGGSLDLAVKLSSLLVPNIDGLEVALKLEYNSKIMEAMQKDSALLQMQFSSFPESYIGNNLTRLYIIVSENTASSSEALINCLRLYMPVILIGTTTYGKNYGSVMFYDENNRFDWAIQPIILKILNANGESDYNHGFISDIYINELNYTLIDLGDMQEPLLAQAISSIINSNNRLKSVKENEINIFYYSKEYMFDMPQILRAIITK